MPDSYWIDSAPLPSHPKINRNIDVDVIVIGAGITGITAAYLAKKAGQTVALLERGRCAAVDTGHTTAHLTAVTDLRLTDIKSHFGRDAARATWDAGAAAIDEIVKLIRREAIDCDFHWMPGYLHAPLREPDPKRIEELEAEATLARDLGIKAEMVPSVPLFGVPGVKFSHQAVFHPRKYLAGLLQAIPGDGSHVFEESPADEISDDPLSVQSGGHRVRGAVPHPRHPYAPARRRRDDRGPAVPDQTGALYLIRHRRHRTQGSTTGGDVLGQR
jgi:glycine/D-amino acid oxidase-like deaminating enzyme